MYTATSCEALFAEFNEQMMEYKVLEFKIDMALHTYDVLEEYGHQPAVYSLASPYLNMEAILGHGISGQESFHENDYILAMESIGGMFKAIGRFIMKVLKAIGNFFKGIWNALFNRNKKAKESVEKQEKINKAVKAKYHDKVPVVEGKEDIEVDDPKDLLECPALTSEDIKKFNETIVEIRKMIGVLKSRPDNGEGIIEKIQGIKRDVEVLKEAKTKQVEAQKNIGKSTLGEFPWDMCAKITEKQRNITLRVDGGLGNTKSLEALIKEFEDLTKQWEKGDMGNWFKNALASNQNKEAFKTHAQSCKLHIAVFREFVSNAFGLLTNESNLAARCRKAYELRYHNTFFKD